MRATPGCKGLSPKENRELPPLRHELVHRLKRDFPALTIVINGGITSDAQIAAQLRHVDGVMVGREAYHHPWTMADWDARFFGDGSPRRARPRRRRGAMVGYMEAWSQPASRGRTRRATCSGCATARPAPAAGARSGRTTGSKALRPAEVAARAAAVLEEAATSREASRRLGAVRHAQDEGARPAAGQVASTMPASASANAAAWTAANARREDHADGGGADRQQHREDAGARGTDALAARSSTARP